MIRTRYFFLFSDRPISKKTYLSSNTLDRQSDWFCKNTLLKLNLELKKHKTKTQNSYLLYFVQNSGVLFMYMV